MFIIMPKYGDDYWFMLQFKTWFESQGIQYPEQGSNYIASYMEWPIQRAFQPDTPNRRVFKM